MKRSLERTYRKMSDKPKLSVEAKIIFALMKDQPQSVEKLCRNAKVDRSSFYRVRRLLINEGILKEIDTNYALWNFVELQSLWDRLQTDIKGAKGNSVKMNMHKASYVGRDKKTGWRMFRYAANGKIEGFMILKNAVRPVSAVRPYGVYFNEEYDGVFLTRNLLGWKDRLVLDDGLFEVRDVEELLDGSDSIGFYVGKLAKVIPPKNSGLQVSSRSGFYDSRDQVREFLVSNVDGNNLTRDDDSTRADHCVMYDNPDYSLLKEFSGIDDPVDGIFVVGIPNSVPVADSDHTVISHDENVPVLVYTMDKVGVSGARLQGKMESELRRVCDSDSVRTGSMHVHLERRGERKIRVGSSFMYSTEFVFKFSRDV